MRTNGRRRMPRIVPLLSLLRLLVFAFCLVHVCRANIEKELFTATVDQIPIAYLEAFDGWGAQREIVTLKPPYSIQRRERITPLLDRNAVPDAIIDVHERWYVLDGLAPGETYEVRTSYATTSPTVFVLEILKCDDAARILSLKGVLKLANDVANSPVATTTRRMLRVRAIYDGVSIQKGRETRPIVYNVVLETLVFGVPRVAFKLVLVLGLTVGISWFIFIPRIYEALKRISKREDVNQKTD